ncbi:uncharacterized protein LOC133181754 [Saccostrea echinata]|uniref:uncharacterized protein LOC133181754 n=1 Tax=Saccostrea echinata TaxID=191078 RepID=UPI002A7FBE29|nr:uncharacterized protein LOC133181754 [Saccostrea echinata]
MFLKLIFFVFSTYGSYALSSSSNTAASGYGERGKIELNTCCKEIVNTVEEAGSGKVHKRSVDNRKPIRPLKASEVLDDANPCLPNPCQHSALCEWTPRSTPPFICHCPVGYVGESCEKESGGIRPEGGETIRQDKDLTLVNVIKMIDGPTATRMAIIFGATVLGIVLIIIIHCCRVLSRKKKEDAEYLKRLQTGDIPKTLPPGCCELSNVVFFETLCCLGAIKDSIKKETAEVDVNQLVSELKLVRSMSRMSRAPDRLIPEERGSKQSLKSNRSKRNSDQRIHRERRTKPESKISHSDEKKDDSYVINFEGGETGVDNTKVDIDYAESLKFSTRSQPASIDDNEQIIRETICSCGRLTTAKPQPYEPKPERSKSQQLNASKSSHIMYNEENGRRKNSRVCSHHRGSYQSVVDQAKPGGRIDNLENQKGSRTCSLERRSHQSFTSKQNGESFEHKRMTKENGEPLLEPLEAQNGAEPYPVGMKQHDLQKSTQTLTKNEEQEYCSVCQPKHRSLIHHSHGENLVSDIPSSRKISAQTQTTPQYLSPTDRPSSGHIRTASVKQPVSPPPLTPIHYQPSQLSGFVRVDKSQNFPSCALNLSPVQSVHQRESIGMQKKLFSLENYIVEGMQENNSNAPGHHPISGDGVIYSHHSINKCSNRTTSMPSSTLIRGLEEVGRSNSDQGEKLRSNFIIHPERSTQYLKDRLQEQHSKPSFHSYRDMYIQENREKRASDQQLSNYRVKDDVPKSQDSRVSTKQRSREDEKEWFVKHYEPIGSRMNARRSYSQPEVFYKTKDVSDPNEIYYNQDCLPKYAEYMNNENEHIVMPIYRVPNTQPSTNPYQTTYREHFGVVQNTRNRARMDRQFVDSGIEVNGSRETESSERYRRMARGSPLSQYLQAVEKSKSPDYRSDRGRKKEREYDFESRSSSRDRSYGQGLSTSIERNLEDDREVLNFLSDRRSVSSFVEAARSSPEDARQSRFSKYTGQRRRSAPSGAVPFDFEERDINTQNDEDVLDYLRKKKTVSALVENSRETMPRTFVHQYEENRHLNIPPRERDREEDEEVLYYLRQRRSVSGRSEEESQERERIMQSVREDYEDVAPPALNTMGNLNEELKYTKMFAKNTVAYPPAAAKIGERKDIKVPIMSRNVFSPPPSNRGSPQRHVAKDDEHSTPYQEFLRKSMIRFPVKDIDIRRSRDALKGNRLQELLNKDNAPVEKAKDASSSSGTSSRNPLRRNLGHYGNNNNIGSRSHLNVAMEEFPKDLWHGNQREGIQYNNKPYAVRGESFTRADERQFLQQVKRRGNEESVNYQIRGQRPRTSTGGSRNLTLNESQDISHFGNDSSFYSKRRSPKHSTPKESPVDPELQRIWESRTNQQQSGSLLEVMRNSQTIQDRFFSKPDSFNNKRTERDHLHNDGWDTDAESPTRRKRSVDMIYQNQGLVQNNQPQHAVSKSSNRSIPNLQTLSSFQGVPASSFHSGVSETLLGPQSLLGDRHQVQRPSFIGYHQSRDIPVHFNRGQRLPSSKETFDSDESIPKTPPPPPHY